MKKAALVSLSLLVAVMLRSQAYYYNYHSTYYENKAGAKSALQNAESDVSGIKDAGWILALDSSAQARYSSTIYLPFNFSFAGQSVAAFKAATTGFITFDTSVTGSPSKRDTIPNVKIPTKSVAVWGLDASGDNDQVIYKVFGNAPNRQLWIKFSSYSNPGDTTGAWNYWSIVLEETSNYIYIVGMYFNQASNLYKSPSLTLGVQETQSKATMIATANTNNFSANSSSYKDNFYYEFIYGNQAQYDLNLQNVRTVDMIKQNIPFSYDVTFNNLGSTQVNTMNIRVQVNGGSVGTYPVTTTLAPNGSGSQTFPVTLSLNYAPGTLCKIKTWVDKPNSTNEIITSNDTQTIKIVVVNGNSAFHKVLIEGSTAVWCGTCPMNDFRLNEFKLNYGDSIVIAQHHSLDEMQSNADTLIREWFDTLGPNMMERNVYWSGSTIAPSYDGIKTEIENRKTAYTPAIVSVENVALDTFTRLFTFKVKVKFTDYCPDNLLLGGMAIEDNVRGTGAGYNQQLSIWLNQNINNPYYGMANPIIGYYFNNVSWNLPGSVWGQPISSPNGYFSPGDSVVLSFSYKYPHLLYTETITSSPYLPWGTIPTHYKPMDMRAVGFVTLNEGNELKSRVLNSDETRLWDLLASTDKIKSASVSVFPNPSHGTFYASLPNGNYTIRIINISGQQVFSTTDRVVSGALKVDATSLQQGLYFVQFTDQNGLIRNARILVN